MRALVAVDLGPSAEGLVDAAAAWARRFDASLHLRTVSVLWGEAASSATILDLPPMADEVARVRQREEARVTELLDRIDRAHRGTSGVLDGVPWRALVDLTGAYDLLIVGTAARSGLARLFLGSVAERLVRHAACPVLVLPRDAGNQPPEGALTVVCPVDPRQANDHAITLARTRFDDATRFEVLGVLPAAPWIASDLGRPMTVSDHPEAHDARMLLHDVAARAQVPEAGVSLRIATEELPGTDIAAFATSVDAHLIALPTHGRTGVSRLVLGSVAERVLRTGWGPVLITR